MSIPHQIARISQKSVSGYLPVYKPKGVCANKILQLLAWDIYFALNLQNIVHGTIPVHYSKYLEPFADGLLTFVVGNDAHKKKNFSLGNAKFRAVIEFGVQRHYHCIDGKVLSKSNIDNVNSRTIEEQLGNFVGSISQNRCSAYKQPIATADEPITSYKDYYRRMNTEPDPKPPKKPQKYSYEAPKRDMIVEAINLTNYSQPFAELEISCYGCFSARQFTVDLASRLGTVASLVELTRVKEGPLELGDMRVLKLEELNIEYYIDRIPALREIYEEFNRDMESIWANLKR